jgi:hypothetical protein
MWLPPSERKEVDYDALAAEALLELLTREHAAVWPEVEARLSERPWRDVPRGINPHHLWKARDQLSEAGTIGASHTRPEAARQCSCGR